MHRRRMRVDGYSDGLNDRPAKHSDAEYQRSWRRGRERRLELEQRGGEVDGG